MVVFKTKKLMTEHNEIALMCFERIILYHTDYVQSMDIDYVLILYKVIWTEGTLKKLQDNIKEGD